MSVFSALNVAVNGLDAQSRAFANVSDNLANTQTVGYKRVDTSFQSLVTASNANINNPGGVSATPTYQNAIQGNLAQVDSSTSLALQGNGFFAARRGVVDATGGTSFSTETFYTRRGDYALSKDGYLVNGAGYYLTGYEVDANGNVNTADVAPIKISALLDNPVATSGITYAANLPAGVPSTYTSSSSTLNLFDNVGGKHEMTFKWATNGAANSGKWNLTMTVKDGAGTAGDLTLTIPVNFDTSGTTAGTLSPYAATGTTAGLVGGTGYTVINPTTTTPQGKATITFPANFSGAGSQTVTLDLGNYGATGGLTQFSDTDLQVTTLQQNGIPRGSFQSLAIDKSGFVSLNYDNGSSKIFYQIPVVQFYSPNNLQRAEGNAFSQTLDSGTPRYSASGKLGAGNITGNSLESSNVDIASEFSKMIQYQRTYSANAKVISTASSLLEEIINVVR
jgi:flagellar hook protein FlgE